MANNLFILMLVITITMARNSKNKKRSAQIVLTTMAFGKSGEGIRREKRHRPSNAVEKCYLQHRILLTDEIYRKAGGPPREVRDHYFEYEIVAVSSTDDGGFVSVTLRYNDRVYNKTGTNRFIWKDLPEEDGSETMVVEDRGTVDGGMSLYNEICNKYNAHVKSIKRKQTSVDLSEDTEDPCSDIKKKFKEAVKSDEGNAIADIRMMEFKFVKDIEYENSHGVKSTKKEFVHQVLADFKFFQFQTNKSKQYDSGVFTKKLQIIKSRYAFSEEASEKKAAIRAHFILDLCSRGRISQMESVASSGKIHFVDMHVDLC